jgi:hypothetical protein
MIPGMHTLSRRPLIVLSALLLLVFSGCIKPKMSWVYYDETRCADKWEYTHNNERLKENFTTYYKSQGVRIYEVEIFSDGAAETCSECSCKTGRRFKAKVKKSEVKNLKNAGFYQ